MVVSNAFAGVLLTDATYTQNFNTMASAGTSNVLPAEWLNAESGTNGDGNYTAGTGSSTTGDTYSFGSTGSTDRALGGLRSGSLIPLFGTSFTNGGTSSLSSLSISYTGEQWRLGAAGRVDRLDFQYSLNATSLTTGTWLDLNALDFAAPVTTGTGALDGNASANRVSISGAINSLSLNVGSTIWVRWQDFDATGSDDGLSIDDFSATATFTAVPEPSSLLLLGLTAGAAVIRCRQRRHNSSATAKV